MRKLELLISQVRQQSENTEFTDQTGIQDSEIIQYANDGQDHIIAAIYDVYPKLNLKTKTLSTVQNEEGYEIPSDCYLGTRIENVEYSQDSNPRNFYRLKPGQTLERYSGQAGFPAFYIRLGSQILLQPQPQSSFGFIRLTYQKKLPRLDVRRGKVSTVSTSGNSITSLVLDTTELSQELAQEIVNQNFMSIVDKFGNVKMQSIIVEGIDYATGIVTLDPDFEFESGETISAGDYIVAGKFSTTHSKLDEVCERYLIAYMVKRLLNRDSSADSVTQDAELQKMENAIVSSYANSDHDSHTIPISDTQYLNGIDW